ncbi:hypothetical protein ACFPIJ_11880 [Dactylosporangium cerinum]|uniref:Uncharacterized protein n=1 Tax=Dactylosporangium cerinum TaxID=1434730 RepID=A0ABV9VV80_9ACTN
MLDETRRALKNYDWLMRNRAHTELDWDSGTLLWGDGGVSIDLVSDPGLTSATADEVAPSRPRTLPTVQPGRTSAEQIVAEAMWDSNLRSERGRHV